MGLNGHRERVLGAIRGNLPVSAIRRPWRDFIDVNLWLHQQHTLVRVHDSLNTIRQSSRGLLANNPCLIFFVLLMKGVRVRRRMF